MRPILDKSIALMITLAVAGFRGFIIGLMISMAAYTIRHYPVWTFVFACFFSLFHLNDLRRFFNERNWFAFCGRLIFLYAITGAIVSFVVVAVAAPADTDRYDLLIVCAAVAGAIPVAVGWTLLAAYGKETSLYRELVGIIDGLKYRGVLEK